MSKILITAIGSFSGYQSIVSLKGEGHYLVGCDINEYHYLSESREVDAFHKVPLALKGEDYIKAIVEICKLHNVEFILALTDPEVDILSEYREHIQASCRAIVCLSKNDSISLSRDKMSVYRYFSNDPLIYVIPTYEFNCIGNMTYPVVVKPKNGRSSEGLIKAYSEDDINSKDPRLRSCIVQPLIEGCVVAVDCVRCPTTNNVVVFAREELIRTKNGAGISVRIIEDPNLTRICTRIMISLDLIGAICLEFLRNCEAYFLMDINPRFSAGISFTCTAGYDVPLNHLRCFSGLEIDPQIACKEMIIVKRYSDAVTWIESV